MTELVECNTQLHKTLQVLWSDALTQHKLQQHPSVTTPLDIWGGRVTLECMTTVLEGMIMGWGLTGSESGLSEELSDEDSMSGRGTECGGTGGSGFGCDWEMVAGMNGEWCGNAGLEELSETDPESEGTGCDSGSLVLESDVAQSKVEVTEFQHGLCKRCNTFGPDGYSSITCQLKPFLGQGNERYDCYLELV